MGQSEGGGGSNQEAGKDSVREGWAGCDDLRLAGSLDTSGAISDSGAHTALGHPFPIPTPPPSSWESRDPSWEKERFPFLFGAGRRVLLV